MQAITSSVLTGSSSRVSNFCTLHSSSNPHKQKSNWVKSGDLGGQLMILPRPIHLLGESVIEMLHHMSGVMRRGSVMVKVHSNPCSQREHALVVLVIHFAESLGNFALSWISATSAKWSSYKFSFNLENRK